MDAPNAAAAAPFRRKPLPGPPPGPPPPPDFDPFPQRHQPLRAARSTPNLRRSATPSIYDPPPAYEEFPGIDSHGQLAVASPAPGPSSFVSAPLPPADARRGYLPYRPQPSSPSEYGSTPPGPRPQFSGSSDAPRPEILPYRPQPSPTFASQKQQPSPPPSDYAAYSPGPPPAASRPEKAPYQLQSSPSSSSSFGPEKQPLSAASSHGGYLPGPPTTPRPEQSPYHLQTSTSFGAEKASSGPEKQSSAAPPSPGPFFPGPPNAHTFPVAAYRPSAPPTPSPSSNVPFFPSPPTAAETFPLAAHQPPISPGYAPSAAPTTDSSQSKEKSFWQTALDETKYFAGGLVSHPFEYTKHHSILRHSSALVWYRGPSTSVTVTIFSDAPLPPTRTLWLQQKGFSGNMGMNLKSLVGANTSWLDVTPSSHAAPADLAEGDERGCQRDIKKFLKKAPKNLAKHLARETHVVRIPAAADDGYFRLVLCSGGGGGGGGGDGSKRKVLCPSPVFRVASTSTDASVVRGASLATMPLEIGIKASSVVATTVVNRYIGPAAAVVQSRAKNLSKAKFVTKHATHIASAKSGIEKSGIKTHVAAYEDQYTTTRGAGYDAWQSGGGGGGGDGFLEEAPPEVIGPDDGPAEPFPIKFDGRVARGTGRGGMELGIPTANLADVPEDVRMRMRGVYFGWARVVPRRGLAEPVSTDWHESIITVGPAPYATPRVAAKNVATVHLIHEFGGALFLDSRLKVLVMGQLRASAPAAAGSDAALAAYGADVLLAVASLSRDGWCPVETRERMRTARSEMSLADRYVETRDKVQKQVDRVPVHLVGVRTEGAALRDRAFGNGGIWIQR